MKSRVKSDTFVVTGRLVLVCLLGFFGLVFAVNGVMVYAAKSTFGGVETSSSYKAGLYFNRDIATAKQQSSLGWHVDGHIARNAAGEAVLDIAARDRNGAPLSGLMAAARLAHPADSRRDHEIDVQATGAGKFRGMVAAAPGQWELIVDLFRGDERMFRSRSRVILK